MMVKPFPMLAAKAVLPKLKFPVLASPKLDGIRAVIHDRQALSRKLLALPNQFVQGFFSHSAYQGLDGELVVGKPNDPLCIKHSTSGIMSRDGEPDFTLYVFDRWDLATDFESRILDAAATVRKAGSERVVLLEQYLIEDHDALEQYEAKALADGYEGVILRDPYARYKHGRSTVREGGMLKMKRYEDSEMIVEEVVEEMFNGNDAERDNFGRTKRSSAKAGKSGKGRAGTLKGTDAKHGWTVEVGSGMNDDEKAEWWAWWQDQARAPRIVKYKYFPVGMQDRPRHPVYVSRRAAMDL